MTELTREEIDRRVLEILRELSARGISHVKVNKIQSEFDEEIFHQTLRPTVERLRDDGDLVPWQDDVPNCGTVYRIAVDYECAVCDKGHDSRGDALSCCGDRFDDRAIDAGAGVSTVSGPVPNALERLEEAGQR